MLHTLIWRPDNRLKKDHEKVPSMQRFIPVFFISVYFEGCNYHGDCWRYGTNKNDYTCCCREGKWWLL